MKKKSNAKLLLIFLGVVIGMLAFAYINVPLFKIYCQKVGIAIAPNAKASPVSKPADREVTVLFTGVVAGSMPVAFKPSKAFERIKLGESAKNEYHFVNLSNDTIRFRPVHSVLPEDAAAKLTLIKCFCFDDQIILPHQEYKLPVIFSFSNSLGPDVERITFHYTLFQKDLREKK